MVNYAVGYAFRGREEPLSLTRKEIILPQYKWVNIIQKWDTNDNKKYWYLCNNGTSEEEAIMAQLFVGECMDKKVHPT
jgi:phosphoserine aminotransferase